MQTISYMLFCAIIHLTYNLLEKWIGELLKLTDTLWGHNNGYDRAMPMNIIHRSYIPTDMTTTNTISMLDYLITKLAW